MTDQSLKPCDVMPTDTLYELMDYWKQDCDHVGRDDNCPYCQCVSSLLAHMRMHMKPAPEASAGGWDEWIEDEKLPVRADDIEPGRPFEAIGVSDLRARLASLSPSIPIAELRELLADPPLTYAEIRDGIRQLIKKHGG